MMKTNGIAPTRTRQKASFPSKSAKWSQEDDEMLIKLAKDGQKVNWNEFVPMFSGKTAQQP